VLELGQAMLWLCAPPSLQLPYTYWVPVPPLCGDGTPTAMLPPLHVQEYGVAWATPPAVICKPPGLVWIVTVVGAAVKLAVSLMGPCIVTLVLWLVPE